MIQSSQPEPQVTAWLLRSRVLEFGSVPLIMGIVNVTPDSFSDGGQYADIDAAVDRALQMAAEGADILDIGGESTRPYSQPVHQQTELDRVIPVIERLARECPLPLSIDTSKAAVAAAAIAAGAEIINDVTGFADPQMVALAVKSNAGICAMHMQGTPQSMQDSPTYDDVVADVASYLAARRDSLVAVGVDPERISLDPGIGFGKTHEHNWELIRGCRQFHTLGRPILIGHSRKGFIGKAIQSQSIEDRDLGSLAISLFLAQQRIQIVRVHNVAATSVAFRLWSRCQDRSPPT